MHIRIDRRLVAAALILMGLGVIPFDLGTQLLLAAGVLVFFTQVELL
jgi:hypothetical protein